MNQGFLNPQEILNKLEISGEEISADFGSGSGGWAIPLAQRLKFGKVYAIDILEEPLSALKSKAEVVKVYNIQTIQADIEGKEGAKLPDLSCDLVLITNLLFQVKNKNKILVEAKRVLKNNGKILIVDWSPEALQGPKEGRISPDEVKEMAKNLNLKLEKEFRAGIYHYSLVFTKP